MSLTKPRASQILIDPIDGLNAANCQELAVVTKDLATNGVKTDLASPTGSSLVGFKAGYSDAVHRTTQSKLHELVSVDDFGAVGNDTTPNDDEFNTMEMSNISAFYLPSGTYYLANTLRLTKSYWGPGQIRFKDGYIQLGLTFTDYPARNDDGHRVIASPADIILRPNGNVTLDGKRLQNVGSPIGELDAVNLKYINSAILPRIQTIEHATTETEYATGTFVPTIQGRVEPGVGTYTRQYGSWVKIGRLVTVRGSISYTDHTGSGGYQITTNAPISTGFANIGTLFITGAYAIDYPTSEVFAGMSGNVVYFYSKRGDGQYTTYLPMPVPTLGIAAGVTSNKFTLEATASTHDHYYVDRTVMIIGGTGAGQSRTIIGYNGSLRQATVNTDWTVQPDSTSQYKITTSGGCEFVITYETNQ